MDYFTISLCWNKTDDPFYSYKTILDDKRLKLRLNDYPEEPMYTLIVDDEIIESFDNWPAVWSKIA